MGTRRASWLFGGEEPEWLVVATALVALALGWVLMVAVTTRTSPARLDGVSWRYPAGWTTGQASEGEFSAGALGSRTRLAVGVLRELDPAAPVALEDLVAQRGFDQAQALAMYRTLSSERTTLGGKAATALHYAYVADEGLIPGALPTVVEGVEYLVPHGPRVYRLSLEAPADERAESEAIFARIVRSVRFE